MGLVSERVPTMNMLKEAHELIEHANYYRVIKGSAMRISLFCLVAGLIRDILHVLYLSHKFCFKYSKGLR